MITLLYCPKRDFRKGEIIHIRLTVYFMIMLNILYLWLAHVFCFYNCNWEIYVTMANCKQC